MSRQLTLSCGFCRPGGLLSWVYYILNLLSFHSLLLSAFTVVWQNISQKTYDVSATFSDADMVPILLRCEFSILILKSYFTKPRTWIPKRNTNDTNCMRLWHFYDLDHSGTNGDTKWSSPPQKAPIHLLENGVRGKVVCYILKSYLSVW